MDLTGGKDVISPAERNEHPAGHSLKRRPSPPLKNRVLVLDAEGNTIDVLNKKEFKKRSEYSYRCDINAIPAHRFQIRKTTRR